MLYKVSPPHCGAGIVAITSVHTASMFTYDELGLPVAQYRRTMPRSVQLMKMQDAKDRLVVRRLARMFRIAQNDCVVPAKTFTRSSRCAFALNNSVGKSPLQTGS
jgi:hypothetical protein